MQEGLDFVPGFSGRLGRAGNLLFEPALEAVAPGPGFDVFGVWLLGPAYKPESADALDLRSVVSGSAGLVAIYPTPD